MSISYLVNLCLTNRFQTISNFFQPLRQVLDSVEFQNPKVARLLCKIIPPSCPFARDIQVFGRTLFHIPPLCKLNPFYEQFVGLRFRALCYLAEIVDS